MTTTTTAGDRNSAWIRKEPNKETKLKFDEDNEDLIVLMDPGGVMAKALGLAECDFRDPPIQAVHTNKESVMGRMQTSFQSLGE